VKVLITEEQYQVLLNERIGEQVTTIFKRLDELLKKIVSDVKKQFGISARFALTYGAGIGALMEPVNKYLMGEFTGLESWQISSLVIAAISIVFYEGSDYRKLKKELAEQGLDDELKIAVTRTEQLREKFAGMLDVLGISLYKSGDILAYTFLLPILGMLINVVNTFGVDSIEFSKFTESLLTSGLITVSSVVLKDVIQKVAKLISNKKS
tara:strand:+ start:574 stop:1203 length:630 start_codon:yes stop_codon:yes gene_type:complete